MYRCPLCGETSNRRGNPFETEQQVVAHVDGSHDDDHDGVTGSEIREQVDRVDTADADGQESQEDVSPSPDEQSATAPAKSGRGTDSSNLSTTPEASDANEGDTVEMTHDEVDTMLDMAADEARAEAYQEGYEQGVAEVQDSDSEADSSSSSSTTTTASRSPRSRSPATSPSGSSTSSSFLWTLGKALLGFVVVLAGIVGLIAANDEDSQNDPWERL